MSSIPRANAASEHQGEVCLPLHQLLIFLITGIIGLGLVLYPLVSNYLYDRRQDGVVLSYQTSVADVYSESRRRHALERAEAYNRQLLTKTGDRSEAESLLDITGTGVIATVEIPSLSLTLPVYFGTDTETLERGVGLWEQSSLPVGGEGTHSVLCGHSGLSTTKLFSDLTLMETGGCFSINVLGEVLTYQVDQITTVLPEDLSQLAIVPGEDYCTLLTCVPYGINTHRLLVRGKRIETMVPKEQLTETESVQSVWVEEYLRSVSLGLVVVLCCVVVSLITHGMRRRR